MSRIYIILVVVLCFSATQESYSQQKVINATESANVWRPFFQMGLEGEASVLGKNVTLSQFLSRGADYSAGDHGCFLKISLFYFRVNGLGSVDSVYSRGSLNDKLAATITANILATKGKWQTPKNTQPSDKCWFIYPAIDPGRSISCIEQQRISRNSLVELLDLYTRAESTTDSHGRIILPPNEFPQYSER